MPAKVTLTRVGVGLGLDGDQILAEVAGERLVVALDDALSFAWRLS